MNNILIWILSRFSCRNRRQKRVTFNSSKKKTCLLLDEEKFWLFFGFTSGTWAGSFEKLFVCPPNSYLLFLYNKLAIEYLNTRMIFIFCYGLIRFWIVGRGKKCFMRSLCLCCLSDRVNGTDSKALLLFFHSLSSHSLHFRLISAWRRGAAVFLLQFFCCVCVSVGPRLWTACT